MANVVIVGGEAHAGNLGVSALGMSLAGQLQAAAPGTRIALQDSRSDESQVVIRSNGSTEYADSLFLHGSRRLRDRCGTRYLTHVGRIARFTPDWLLNRTPLVNRTLTQLMNADAIVDISGGDSFCDIYGDNGFRFQVGMKRMALRLGKPLILAPQTYGPFRSEEVRKEARSVIEQASVVATREARGLEELEELMGRALDSRFFACPDVAFSLEPQAADVTAEPFFAEDDGSPIVGLNISGLMYLSKRDFGIEFSYPELVRRLARWFVERARARVLLVPHVLPYLRAAKSKNALADVDDRTACKAFLEDLDPEIAQRVGVLQGSYNPAEIKTFMARCEFFVGARMHACIGALSQGVPTAAMAYSKKFDGVMGLAGLLDAAVECRGRGLEECYEQVVAGYEARAAFREQVVEQIARIKREIRTAVVEKLVPALGTPTQGAVS